MVMPATTLQAYGFDSYPFHHLANRLCMPYPQLMAVVEGLRLSSKLQYPTDVSRDDYMKICDAFLAERRRQVSSS